MSKLQNFKNKNTVTPLKQAPNYKVIIAGVVAIATIGVVGGLLVTNTNKNSTSNSSSSVSQNVTLNTSSISSSLPTTTTNYTPSTDELEKGRQIVEQYEQTAAAQAFNPVSFDNVPVTSDTVKNLRQTLGDSTNTISAGIGKEIKLTITYSSVGDQAFDQGSLIIKLSDGLSLVPNSLKDNFNGSVINVSDSVFDASKSLITYGPGTVDKASAKVEVSQKGSFTLNVKVKDGAPEETSVSSYMRDLKDSQRVGKPAIYFISNVK